VVQSEDAINTAKPIKSYKTKRNSNAAKNNNRNKMTTHRNSKNGESVLENDDENETV